MTSLVDDDLNNSIFQSLLSQHSSILYAFEELLYFAPCYNNTAFKEKMSILRAINEVLTCPFFEIRQFTPEEINTEFAKPSNGFRKTPPNVERFRKYVEGLD